MKLENGDLTCTAPELAALADHFNTESGPLSRLPELDFGEAERAAVASWLSQTSDPFRDDVGSWLRQLGAPNRVGVMHQTIGDEEIGRAMLAWADEIPGQVVMLMNTGSQCVIRAYPIQSLVETFHEVLMVTEPTRVTPFARRLSAEALIVFVAIADLLKEHRLYSLLTQHLPSGKFTQQGVADMIGVMGQTDFRWPGRFIDKVMPRPVATLELQDDLVRIFRELQDLEMIMDTTDDEGVACYQLTDFGEVPARVLWDHITKIGLRISLMREDGKRGNEIFLFVRSPADLCLFDVGGSESIATTLGPAQLRQFVSGLLVNPSEKGEGVVETEREEGGSLSCPSCGGKIADGAAHCPDCGMAVYPQKQPAFDKLADEPPVKKTPKARPVVRESAKTLDATVISAGDETAAPAAKFCRKCGAELDNAAAAFCRKCGAKLSE